jgi:hypothetical protein
MQPVPATELRWTTKLPSTVPLFVNGSLSFISAKSDAVLTSFAFIVLALHCCCRIRIYFCTK